MNRRNFLKFLATATVGTGVVYSFPSIIVPKNISEVYPKAIDDFFFQETSFDAYLRKNMIKEVYLEEPFYKPYIYQVKIADSYWGIK